jgi:hypothetical protein
MKEVLNMDRHCIVTAGMAVVLVACFSSSSRAAAGARFEVQAERGISYISGGVGIDERDALRAMTRDYSLQLGFAQTSGSYLSGVNVEIQDAAGHPILQSESKGPWFFADLPAGKYTVWATTMGDTQQKVTRVTENRQKTLYFYW